MNRSQEREQAFVILFEKAFNPDVTVEELSEMAVDSGFVSPSEFTKNLMALTEDNIKDIDGKIAEYAIGWSLDRMPKVSLSILRIAVCEMLYMDDVPVSVSINEAVNLAKKYAGKEDGKYINGVLGSVARSVEK